MEEGQEVSEQEMDIAAVLDVYIYILVKKIKNIIIKHWLRLLMVQQMNIVSL